MVNFLVCRCLDVRCTHGIKHGRNRRQTAIYAIQNDGISQLHNGVKSRVLRRIRLINIAANLRKQSVCHVLCSPRAGYFQRPACIVTGCICRFCIQQDRDAGDRIECRRNVQTGHHNAQVDFILTITQRHQPQLTGVGHYPVAAIGNSDMAQQLSHGVIGRITHHEVRVNHRPFINLHADSRGDLIGYILHRLRPCFRAAAAIQICLLRLQHGVVAVDRQQAGNMVGLSGVNVVNAFPEPVGLDASRHRTDPHADFGHARDDALRLHDQIEFLRYTAADADGIAGEQCGTGRYREQLAFAVIHASDGNLCFHPVFTASGRSPAGR